ncbi:MAG TPA: EXLDI protein [Phytomonospora sp.]
MEVPMPNKTIYVSDDDMPLYKRAQELAGGSLSAAIGAALRRYVELQEGAEEGYDEITVRVGVGVGRKQRFSGVLLGEWGRSKGSNVEAYQVYRTRRGKFVVHTTRTQHFDSNEGEDGNWVKDLNWRALLGIGEQVWASAEDEKRIEIVDTLAELEDKIPPKLFEMVSALAEEPAVEDLDI